MTRFSTINPPAAISYFAPAGALEFDRWDGSLIEARIRSAFQNASRELHRYEHYSPLWDGYRAQPFTPEVLANAAAILLYSEKVFLNAHIAPQLVTTGPASDGSIDVEFEVGDKRVLMTLYPKLEEVNLSIFDRERVHQHVAQLGEQTVEDWISWLRQPSAVPDGVDQDQVHPR